MAKRKLKTLSPRGKGKIAKTTCKSREIPKVLKGPLANLHIEALKKTLLGQTIEIPTRIPSTHINQRRNPFEEQKK
jgi:hypothetical protein